MTAPARCGSVSYTHLDVYKRQALLAFSLEFTGRGDRLTAGVLWFLAIEPVMTLVLLWTDPWHGLFFGSQRTATSGAILTGGPAFWFNIIYSYTVILIACVVLILSLIHI